MIERAACTYIVLVNIRMRVLEAVVKKSDRDASARVALRPRTRHIHVGQIRTVHVAVHVPHVRPLRILVNTLAKKAAPQLTLAVLALIAVKMLLPMQGMVVQLRYKVAFVAHLD